MKLFIGVIVINEEVPRLLGGLFDFLTGGT